MNPHTIATNFLTAHLQVEALKQAEAAYKAAYAAMNTMFGAGGKLTPEQSLAIAKGFLGQSKNGPKPPDGRMSAAEFIRQHPDKTPRDIVKLGQEAGIPVRAGNVHSVRNYDRHRTQPVVPVVAPPQPTLKVKRASPTKAPTLTKEEWVALFQKHGPNMTTRQIFEVMGWPPNQNHRDSVARTLLNMGGMVVGTRPIAMNNGLTCNAKLYSIPLEEDIPSRYFAIRDDDPIPSAVNG